MVVLLTKGQTEVIGRYSHGGPDAHSTTWYIDVVDMAKRQLVASKTTSMSDPRTLSNFLDDDADTPPLEKTIVSIISETVTFE